VSTSLSTLEEMLPITDFCRVHRGYIVAIGHIDSVSTSIVYIGDIQIPIAKAYRKELLSRLEVIW
jgi:two-component system response regulator LytT